MIHVDKPYSDLTAGLETEVGLIIIFSVARSVASCAVFSNFAKQHPPDEWCIKSKDTIKLFFFSHSNHLRRCSHSTKACRHTKNYPV